MRRCTYHDTAASNRRWTIGCGIVCCAVRDADRSTSPAVAQGPGRLLWPADRTARPPRAAALRVALIYAAVGAAWILFSDLVLEAFFSADQSRQYHLQTIKGWTYIAVTASLVYMLIRNTFTAVRASAEAQRLAGKRTRLLVERVRDYAIFT